MDNGLDNGALLARVAVLEQWKTDHESTAKQVHEKIDKLQESIDRIQQILKWAAFLVFGSAAGGNALSEIVTKFLGAP